MLKQWGRIGGPWSKLFAGRRIRLGLAALVVIAGGTGLGSNGDAARAGETTSCQLRAPGTAAPLPRAGVDYDARFTLISFTNQCGQQIPLAVDVAASEARRERGLMFITSLPADQGELFAFNDLNGGNQVLISFYMKDTLIPLSIAFIGRDGVVHEIQDMQPNTLDLHTPAEPYLYAIEVNQGWYAAHDIGPGSTLDLSPILGLVQPAAPSP